MADNIPITAGAGTTVATDDAAGVHYPFVKLVDGTLNSTIVIPGSANGLFVQGGLGHDAPDAGNPLKIGAKAVAHGVSPAAVAASDRSDLYVNRHGILFTIGGHPNVVSIRANFTTSQADTVLVNANSGEKIIVTQVQVTASNANTASPGAVIGFGTVSTPTTTGVVAAHPGIPGGGGFSRGDGSGILGIGSDAEDLRITSGIPTGGSLDVVISYYIVPS